MRFKVVNQPQAAAILGLPSADEFGFTGPLARCCRCAQLNTVLADESSSEAEDNPLQYNGSPVRLTLRNDARPANIPARKVPLAFHDEVRSQLKSMLDDNIIERVATPTAWCSPMLLVPKKGGKFRLCMDPLYLNRFLLREVYPLPSLDQLTARLSGAKFFSAIDLKWGFWQLPLDDESSWLCTFSTPFGRFRFKRLPFGVSPAPEIFHRVVHESIEDLDGVQSYIDDILVSGRTQEEHDARLAALMERLKERGFTINVEKSVFCRRSVKYLGHRISSGRIEVDPDRAAAIRDLPAPQDVAGLRRMLGMVNYMQMFVPNLANMTGPMRALLKKNVAWHWSPDCETAFTAVKRVLLASPALALFNERMEVTVAADASSFGLGGVLLQEGRPVVYTSRSLLPAERRYSQIEKELLGIVYSLERLEFYTRGRQVVVQTDHKPLLGLVDKQIDELSPR
ncbi:MAG TPA: reverse transcriptase family protein, partial [Sideroxyarcus sp.]|nr:reverse transcriptase family protein [Sideroxyarcus sp.]